MLSMMPQFLSECVVSKTVLFFSVLVIAFWKPDSSGPSIVAESDPAPATIKAQVSSLAMAPGR